MVEAWYQSEQSLTLFIIGVAVLVTIGPLVFPLDFFQVCRSDLFAILILAGVVWYGRACNPQANTVMLGLLISYLFLSTFKGEDRETFCPSSTLNMFGMAAPVEDSPPPDSSSSFESPPRCNYTSHPDLEKTENTPMLMPPKEWLGPESSAEPPHLSEVSDDFEAYEGNSGGFGGADFNASFH